MDDQPVKTAGKVQRWVENCMWNFRYENDSPCHGLVLNTSTTLRGCRPYQTLRIFHEEICVSLTFVHCVSIADKHTTHSQLNAKMKLWNLKSKLQNVAFPSGVLLALMLLPMPLRAWVCVCGRQISCTAIVNKHKGNMLHGYWPFDGTHRFWCIFINFALNVQHPTLCDTFLQSNSRLTVSLQPKFVCV